MAAKQTEAFTTSKTSTEQMPTRVEGMIRVSDLQRQNFQRRWYDNNMFDDGFHFRYVERSTNKIVDLSRRRGTGGPIRAIPKASRQIRGVANLLMSGDPVPVVYPEKLNKENYSQDDDGKEYQEARDTAAKVAKQIGHWIQEEWKDQELTTKMAHMAILAGKHGVSFMQIWPDAVDEKIKTKVYDAFDIRLMGSLTELQDCPFIIKSIPTQISRIKANENFDEKQLEKISPDNRYASSEIKEAYLSRRFGREQNSEDAASILLHEAFVKEYVNDEVRKRVQMFGNGDKVLKDRKDGDTIIRHTFIAGGVWLMDEYLSTKKYPFVDFRYEPGPLYQVPLIERFIPSNKSLDNVVSRLEKILHSLVVGTWAKKRGENYTITNQAGGQFIEYDVTPPVQGQMAGVPAYVFNFINLLNSFIEEQGVTTSTLGKLPSGVKAASAIESLKESEMSNLVIPNRQLKMTIKQITERFIDIAGEFFITPQTVFVLDKGEPDYFDIIGEAGVEARENKNIDVPESIPISSDIKVDIEIESGLGFTRQGQLANAQDLAGTIMQLAEMKMIPPEAVKAFIRHMLEIYQFGNLSEFMEAMESAEGENDMTEEQIEQIKLAVLEVMKDIEKAKGGPKKQQEERIEEAKLGTGEAISDIQKAMGTGGQQQEQEEEKPPSKSISFKDLPPAGQAQMAQQAGIDITAEQVAAAENARAQKKGGDGNAK